MLVDLKYIFFNFGENDYVYYDNTGEATNYLLYYLNDKVIALLRYSIRK